MLSSLVEDQNEREARNSQTAISIQTGTKREAPKCRKCLQPRMGHKKEACSRTFSEYMKDGSIAIHCILFRYLGSCIFCCIGS